ncbi:MAG: OmpH family outer membrane protein [Bacteroides sp.]
MKKSIFVTLLVGLIASTNVFAQKFAFIDTEYILSNISEYTSNQNKIDSKAKTYQDEIQKASEDFKKMIEDFQAKAKSMNESQRTKMQETILQKEQAVMELGNKYFGPDGAIEDMKAKLLDPFYDKIYEASKIIATKEDYAAIIDRATATSIIFALPQYDISNEVLAIMGYSK